MIIWVSPGEFRSKNILCDFGFKVEQALEGVALKIKFYDSGIGNFSSGRVALYVSLLTLLSPYILPF